MQLDRYEKRVRNNVSERTLKARMAALRKLEQYVKGEPSVEDVEDFLDLLIDKHDDGEIKASVIREYFKSIDSYFNVVKSEPEALDHITWLPTSDSDPGDYMKLEEWQAFFQQIRSYRDKALFMTMYQYARRPTEVILLNEEDIGYHEEEDRDIITFSILKKGSSSNTPTSTIWIESWDEEYDVYRTTYELRGDAKKYLDKWISMSDNPPEKVMWTDIDTRATPEASIAADGGVREGEKYEVHPLFNSNKGRLTYNSVYNATKSAAERAIIDEDTTLGDIKNITPKTLRHSRSTHLDWNGKAPANIARDMLLHDPETGTSVVGHYIHDRGESDIRDVMEIE